MRKLRDFCYLLLLSMLLPMKAAAQTDYGFDVDKFTCVEYFDKVSQLHKTNKQTASLLTYWLFGYVSGIQNSGKMFQSRYLEFNKSLANYCKKNPNELLLVSVRKLDFKM
jgi:hypothetical protein